MPRRLRPSTASNEAGNGRSIGEPQPPQQLKAAKKFGHARGRGFLDTILREC